MVARHRFGGRGLGAGARSTPSMLVRRPESSDSEIRVRPTSSRIPWSRVGLRLMSLGAGGGGGPLVLLMARRFAVESTALGRRRRRRGAEDGVHALGVPGIVTPLYGRRRWRWGRRWRVILFAAHGVALGLGRLVTQSRNFVGQRGARRAPLPAGLSLRLLLVHLDERCP